MDVGEAAEDQEVEQVKNLEQLLTASALPLLRLALTQRMVQSKRWKWGDFVWDESRSGSLFGANASVYGANAPFFGHNAPYGGNAFAYGFSAAIYGGSAVVSADSSVICADRAAILRWQGRLFVLAAPPLYADAAIIGCSLGPPSSPRKRWTRDGGEVRGAVRYQPTRTIREVRY